MYSVVELLNYYCYFGDIMSDDKPINAMYGQKVKLDLDKIRNRSKKEEVVESEPEEVVEEPVVEEAVEEVVEEPVEEEAADGEVVEEPVEEVVEEVEEPVVEEAADDEVVEEPVVEEAVEEVVEEPAVEQPVEEKPADAADSELVDNLKAKLTEREKKLSNQSSELNYLTNKVIPKLKKEVADLTKVKDELSDALEKSTKKYFDQLDINADLSGKIGKIGADSAVNRVRADKLEAQLDTIKDDLEAKIQEYKDKLNSLDLEDVRNENSDLKNQVNDLDKKLESARKENSELYDEVNKLRTELIEIGNYKDEVDRNYKKELTDYKDELSSLKAQLKVKESSYDKLSNESKKTISELNAQVKKLEEQLDKQSNRGLFDRFK